MAPFIGQKIGEDQNKKGLCCKTNWFSIRKYVMIKKKGCCCCSAYLSFCHRIASDANLLDDPHTFRCSDYFVIGGIRTCLGVSDDPMFLWISSNSCPLNLLLVRSHQAEIIIAKHLIQGRNSVTRVRVEPRSFDHGRRKNEAFTHSPTLPRSLPINLWVSGSQTKKTKQIVSPQNGDI